VLVGWPRGSGVHSGRFKRCARRAAGTDMERLVRQRSCRPPAHQDQRQPHVHSEPIGAMMSAASPQRADVGRRQGRRCCGAVGAAKVCVVRWCGEADVSRMCPADRLRPVDAARIGVIHRYGDDQRQHNWPGPQAQQRPMPATSTQQTDVVRLMRLESVEPAGTARPMSSACA
jgi:hypothetical protein